MEREGEADNLDNAGLYAYLNDRVLAPDPLYHGPFSYYYPYHSFWEGTAEEPSSRDFFNCYGWSWFGNQPLDFEAYGDGKAGPYNVKYDSDFGAWLQFLRTGDDRWREMAEALTGYLELLMLHDVVTDTGYDVWRWRDAIFGHSQHGETGNQNGQRNYLGPVSDTAYGSRGALLHYYLTGDPVSKRFIDKAAEHMYMFYSDEYYPDKRFEGLSYLSNSASREYANALSTLVERGSATPGTLNTCSSPARSSDISPPIGNPGSTVPRAGSEGYVSSWQLTMYLAAVGRYAELTTENGLAEAAQAAESLLVDYTDWILSFATKDHNGEYSIFYSWGLRRGQRSRRHRHDNQLDAADGRRLRVCL